MYSDIMERTGSGKSFTLPGRKKAVIPRTSSSSAAPIVQQGPSVLTEVLATDPLPRVLHEGDARTEYRRRTGEMKTTLHWNDRKLLLQEAEFLTEFAGVEAASVVYVGPSPGSHINLLSNMFPAVSFILIDPTTPACEETKRVKYVESRLTPDKVRDITARFCGRAKKTLLISNMKSSKSYSAKQTDNDPWTAEDLQLQIDIVSRVEGVDAAMLKLRLPYTSGATELPKGRIMLPVWGGQTSTETRLVVAPPFTMTRYEHKTYEEQLFHFNTSTRLKTYPEYAPAHSDHPRHKTAVKGIGYDWRYDTTREIAILDAYVRQAGMSYFTCKSELEGRRKREALLRETRGSEEKNADRKRKREERELASASSAADVDWMAPLLAKTADDLHDQDVACIVAHLSDEISLNLIKGRHTLATHPLTYLHAPRTPENPYNQTLRVPIRAAEATPLQRPEKIVPGNAAQPADTEKDNEAPAAAEETVVQKQAAPQDTLLSAVGFDVGSDDSGSEEEEDGPARKRMRLG